MSNFLAVDTSSRYLTVLAQKGERRVLRHLEDCAMKHSVMLMDEADKALDELGLKPSECDFFAAVTGPGSFTGIRIGISAVKGFALGADKPLVSVTAFDLIAYNVNSKNFYVAIDAAHGHYYVRGYGECGLAPCYMSAEQAVNLGAPFYGFEDLDLPVYTRLNAGECLYRAVCACEGEKSSVMNALYVRKSQAEEGRK